jgi:hypothetical protein
MFENRNYLDTVITKEKSNSLIEIPPPVARKKKVWN